MTYQVIARKWRPQVFSEMVGQEHVTQTLENAIKQGRIHHAYLFAGARGVGKTSAARILSKSLNCEQGPTHVPCNVCPNCKEITNSSSIDVIELDGASHTGVDDVRAIQENVPYLPANARYKIYIIDEVHMLSQSAFNALLKTLEEPPDHVVFIFATTESHKIPATIISRCQRFDFRRILPRDIVGQLKKIVESESFQISEAGLHLIARQANGSMRDSQSILDQVISFGGTNVKDEDISRVLGLIDREILNNLISAILKQNPTECLTVFDHAFNYGYDLTQLALEVLTTLRNMLVAKVAPESDHLLELSSDEVEQLRNQVKDLSPIYLEQLFTILSDSVNSINRSLTPRMVMEVVLLKMIHTPLLIPIDDIISKIDDISQRIGQGGMIAESNPQPAYTQTPPQAPPQPTRPTPPEANKEDDVRATEAQPPMPEPEPVAAPTQQKIYGDSSERWAAFLEMVKEKDALLGTIMEHARVEEFDNEKLRMVFEKRMFFDNFSEQENKEKAQKLLADFNGGDVRIEVKDISAKVKKKKKEQRAIEESKRKQLNQEARDNPVVQEAMKIFESDIKEIKFLDKDNAKKN